MLRIRTESPADYGIIREINTLAFGRPIEGQLVDQLREMPDFIADLSLVAEWNGRPVGHLLISPARIHAPEGPIPILNLAPVAVLPEFQNRGIGSALMRHALETCRRFEYGIVIVVGHAEYYPRFGFLPARRHGIEAPFPVPDEAFMVYEVHPGALGKISGTIEYPPPFDGCVETLDTPRRVLPCRGAGGHAE
jgi:putative acetyltransferase